MTRTTLVATLLALASFAPRSEAQCPRPDFLDGGPCCAPAQPNYPIPNHFRQKSLAICWKDCNTELVQNVLAEWTPNAFPATPCKIFTQKLTIRGGGSLLWSGRVTLQYSRTWLEVDATGLTRQVWRYLANGDLRPTAAAGPMPCPVPPCAPAHGNNVRYTGYVDQVENCDTGADEYAWMLSHVCDQIDHTPGFPRAGVFHPDRSYTFVGPSAGFVVSSVVPPEPGASPFEDVRRVVRVPGVFGLTCEFEEPIQESLNLSLEGCLCGAAGTNQWFLGDLNIFGACGTSISTSAPLFYLSMGIGRWTDPTRYPGPEWLRWNAGSYDYTDPCTGITRQEVFFGVTTLEGFDAIQLLSSGPAGPLPFVFIDQCNSIRAGGGTVMNVPYRPSDHFLNLNH